MGFTAEKGEFCKHGDTEIIGVLVYIHASINKVLKTVCNFKLRMFDYDRLMGEWAHRLYLCNTSLYHLLS